MASYRSNESWYRTFRQKCLCAELQCTALHPWGTMHAQHHRQWSEMHGSRVYGIRAFQLVIQWSLLKELPLYHAAMPYNVGALVTAWLVTAWLCRVWAPCWPFGGLFRYFLSCIGVYHGTRHPWYRYYWQKRYHVLRCGMSKLENGAFLVRGESKSFASHVCY